MNVTAIEYLNFTWSPLCGCTGTDCAVIAKCWAKYQAKRRLHKCRDCYDFIPHTHFERLTQPLKVKSTKRIGACFSADMWDIHFTEFDRQMVLVAAAVANQHWFINLTKQPQNIPEDRWFPDNWVQGVSVCTQKDLWRIETLKKTSAKTKMISFEPLYEYLGIIDLTDISWIIIGNQMHPLKEANPVWIDSLIIDAKTHDTAVFIKNNVNHVGSTFNLKEYPQFFLWVKQMKEMKEPPNDIRSWEIVLVIVGVVGFFSILGVLVIGFGEAFILAGIGFFVGLLLTIPISMGRGDDYHAWKNQQVELQESEQIFSSILQRRRTCSIDQLYRLRRQYDQLLEENKLITDPRINALVGSITP